MATWFDYMVLMDQFAYLCWCKHTKCCEMAMISKSITQIRIIISKSY